MVGIVLAGLIGRDLADSDLAIEARFGTTGAVIAAEHGVSHLHRLERDVLLEALLSPRPMVIASAASVVDLESTRTRLAEETCVWLTATADAIASRVGGSSHRRVIGPGDQATVAARAEHYHGLATTRVDTTLLDPAEAAEVIVSRLGSAVVAEIEGDILGEAGTKH